MSRLKIWGFAALVVAIGLAGVWVFTQRASVPAMEQVSATLRSGTLQFETGTRLLSRQVRDVAAVAARDPGLLSALARVDAARAAPGARPPAVPGARPPATPRGAGGQQQPPPDLATVAVEAVQGAAALLEVDMGRAPLVGWARGEGSSLWIGDRRIAAGDPIAQALLGPGEAPRHVRVDDALYAVAVHRAEQGVTLAFGLPIDPRWGSRLQAATGADLSFIGSRAVSTLPPPEAAVVVAATLRTPGEVVDGGRLGPVPAASGLPGIPLLFLRAPAFRARAVTLPGIEGPVAVLSAPVRPAFEPVAAFQQVMLLGLLLLGLVGVALGLSREPVVPSHVPRELAAAADRISRGDFDARVPRMSGTFGTLASALSRASEVARLARIGQGATIAPLPTPPGGPIPLHPAMPAPTLDVPLHAVPPDEPAAPSRADEPFPAGGGLLPPGTPTPIPIPLPVEGRAGSPLTAASAVAAAQAARAHHPRTTQPIGVEGPTTPPAGRDTPPPPGRDTPPPGDGDGEAGWRGVYEEFLRARVTHGETVEGVTWDRFSAKLRRNRDLLAEKYACRTVRFQVYVKDGKAALKATPVR